MKKHVAIIVTGQPASGKSTVMHLIEKLLKKEGFTIEIDLEGNYDYKNLNDFNVKMGVNEAERFQALKEKTKIMIKEMPMRNVPTINKKYENEVKATNNK
ncbi:MAG: adenylyl-sulfate kinase [Candidatus Paceibacterota bacterium]